MSCPVLWMAQTYGSHTVTARDSREDVSVFSFELSEFFCVVWLSIIVEQTRIPPFSSPFIEKSLHKLFQQRAEARDVNLFLVFAVFKHYFLQVIYSTTDTYSSMSISICLLSLFKQSWLNLNRFFSVTFFDTPDKITLKRQL